MNFAVMSGNIGKNPDLKTTANGAHILDLSVAVKGWSKQKGEFTTWWKVRVLGNLAKTVAERCGTGTKIWVSGPMLKDEWVKDTEKKSVPYLLVDKIEWAVGPPKAPASAPAPTDESGGAY